MSLCPSCGQENPAGAKFCNACGASLTVPAAATEQRKIVTVVFSDVTGSTALGERLDPESLRRVLARYFDLATSGGFLYAETGMNGTVDEFSVNGDGTLNPIGTVTGLPPGIEGIASS